VVKISIFRVHVGFNFQIPSSPGVKNTLVGKSLNWVSTLGGQWAHQGPWAGVDWGGTLGPMGGNPFGKVLKINP